MAAARKRAAKRSARKPGRKPKGKVGGARPGAGRPTKRTPEVEGQILRALRNGCAIVGAAAIAEVHKDTIHNWKRQDPEFSAACENAMGQASARMAATLFEKALRGDTTAIIWWQKCRDPEFREAKDQSVEIDVGDRTGHELMSHMLIELARQVAAGKRPPSVLREAAEAMGKASDVLERADLEARIRKLEGRG